MRTGWPVPRQQEDKEESMSEPQALATEPRITTEVRDHVLLIGLNRPKKKNAFDLQMLEEYAAAFVELERTPELRVGLVFAHGSDFTAGLDLANVGPAVAAGKNLFPDGAIDPFRMHEPFGRKPVIGAAHGLCLTVGIEMLLSFDIRLAAEGTRFGQIEIKRGIFPFGGATFRWVSNCGWGNAMRYLLTADELDAAEAYRIGLVQEVVAPDKLLARALELAHRVAAQAPLGVMETLINARLSVEAAERAAVAELMPAVRRIMNTEDAREGVASFLERRTGNFKGR
jgi:enoyl-CoA hydratase